MEIFVFLLVAAVLAAIFLLVLIPVGVALLSVLAAVLPWLLVGFVIWAVATRGRRSRRHRQASGHRHAPPVAPTSPVAPVPSAPATAPGAPTPYRGVQPRHRSQPRPDLPPGIEQKIVQVRRKAAVLLDQAERFPTFSQDLYLVRQAATEYLPRTLEAYLALPPGYREVVEVASGKTALQELEEQLDLLNAKLDEIGEDIQGRNVDRLLANRHFLEERFRRAEEPTRFEAREPTRFEAPLHRAEQPAPLKAEAPARMETPLHQAEEPARIEVQPPRVGAA